MLWKDGYINYLTVPKPQPSITSVCRSQAY